MTSRESAVIVAVAEAEPLVGGWRLRYAEDAQAGVPAHVTLLYPFVPADELDEEVEREVASLVGRESPFEFRLASVERFAAGILYLAPEPAEPFVRLSDALVDRFPEYPRYGDPDLSFVPHLTVAYGDAELFARIEPELAPELPIAARVEAALLIEQDTTGRWHDRARLPLGTSTAHAV
jgi:2'-5' RNA ligase